MVGWSVIMRLSLVWYGRKKLNPMSMRNPRSTIRLITNRASTVTVKPSPSPRNATSYGVNVAVKSRNVPTSASQYIIRGLRGFRSHGFFRLRRPNDVGNPRRAFSSSSSAFKIFADSGRRGSKSSSGPWYATDAERPKRECVFESGPVRGESRRSSSAAAPAGATSLAPRSYTCCKLKVMFCWFLSSKFASCTPVYRPPMTPPLVPQPFCPRRPVPALEGPQPPPEAPEVTCPPPSPKATPDWKETPEESVEARGGADGSSSPSREALGARRLRRAPPNLSRRTGSAGAYFAAAEARLRSRMSASLSVPDALASASLPARDRPLGSRIRPCFTEEDGSERSGWSNASPEP